jgi:hypothetical protein
MGDLHKVFISYHDGRTQPTGGDWQYREYFERLFAHYAEVVISRAVQPGDIKDGLATETIRQKIRDEYLRDSSVTIVLVGQRTWQRKHVDWEIGSSIRHTDYNPRSGLLGILLPSHPDYASPAFRKRLVPPRLWDNIACDYAKMYDWTDNPAYIQQWVHEAFLRRKTVLPDNSRPHFAVNRTGDHWSD